MEKPFNVYFDSLVYDRFSKFDSDFEAIYDEVQEDLCILIKQQEHVLDK